MNLPTTFERLYRFLHDRSYVWMPQTPDQLLKMRKAPYEYPALVRFFGLGLPVALDELVNEGMPDDLARDLLPLKTAVSRSGNVYIAHDHWPPRKDEASRYVHLGRETFTLLEEIQARMETLLGSRVLDLGSGAGALALEIASIAREVWGLELSQQAVDWANASAQANGLANTRFIATRIGSPEADAELSKKPAWDYVVFNPPMMIPHAQNAFLHRDGGELGVELPMVFLNFALRHLKTGGEVWCIATNPIVHGRSVFFDRLKQTPWERVEEKRLNPRFHQSTYRKEGYEARGIERVELWFLRLRKPGG